VPWETKENTLNYGMGIQRLARQIGCEPSEAKEKQKLYLDTYEAVERFRKQVIKEGEQSGYAFTLLGRRRSVPEINSPRKADKARAIRVLQNTPIQGSAADVVKLAQNLCYEVGLEETYGARPLLQVHDELVFECPAEMADQVKAELRMYMEHPLSAELAVPLTVDIGVGPSWGHAH
jgi:DNA polymerase-1